MRRDGIGVKGRQNIYLLYSAASNVATLSGIIVCTQPRLVVKDETYCGHGNHATSTRGSVYVCVEGLEEEPLNRNGRGDHRTTE